MSIYPEPQNMSSRVFTNLSSISSSCCINPQKKKILPDVHFQSQLNAPPEFPIGSKYLAAGWTYIFLWPKLQNPYPWSVLGAGETVRSSMPQGTLLYPAYICHETPREYHGLPWGFSGQPAPAPAGTLTCDLYGFLVKTSPKTCFLDSFES